MSAIGHRAIGHRPIGHRTIGHRTIAIGSRPLDPSTPRPLDPFFLDPSTPGSLDPFPSDLGGKFLGHVVGGHLAVELLVEAVEGGVGR